MIFGIHPKSCQKHVYIYIYFCFGFADGKHYFIKYNKEQFDSFDTKYIDEWHATNYSVPLKQCISVHEFVDDIKLLTSSC